MASKLTFLILPVLPNKPHPHSTKLHPLPLISSRLNLSKDPTILNTPKILDQSSNVLKTASLSLTALTLPFLLGQKARNMPLVVVYPIMLQRVILSLTLWHDFVETGCGTCC